MDETQHPSNRIEVVSPGNAMEAAYFASALARELVATPGNEDAEVLLVDGLRGCGGLDVALDLESHDGVRWPSLRGARGQVDSGMLIASLPVRDGVGVLSHSQNGGGTCTPDVAESVVAAISEHVTWCVESRSDEIPPPESGNLLLLVHGSICGLAAANAFIRGVGDGLPVGLLLLETPAAQRAMVEEELGAPVVAHTPTRWHMSAVAARNVLEGKWPHHSDRAFAALVKDAAIYVRSHGRCLAWA